MPMFPDERSMRMRALRPTLQSTTPPIAGGARLGISRIYLTGRDVVHTHRAGQDTHSVLRPICAAEIGGIGAILRREGVYSSSLTEWR